MVDAKRRELFLTKFLRVDIYYNLGYIVIKPSGGQNTQIMYFVILQASGLLNPIPTEIKLQIIFKNYNKMLFTELFLTSLGE